MGNNISSHSLIKPSWLSLFRNGQLPEVLIILAYIFFVTYVPRLNALDSNTTKFLVLSMINIPALLMVMLRKKYYSQPGLLTVFFRTNVGIAYSALLILSLISFTQAINIAETLIHFSRLFAVFTAVYIVSAILLRNMEFLKLIVVTLSLMLIIDSLAVFYFIYQFTQGDISTLMDIKFIYSNKNIFASALYIKLPFALYMLLFYGRRLKVAGAIAITLGILATLFMASRVFFIGIFLFSIVFVIYNLVLFFRKKTTRYLAFAGSYIGMLLLGLIVFYFVQQRFYPETRERRAAGIIEQLSLITKQDRSTYDRIRLYDWSFKLIKENPWLGVGTGNWKINILKYENQENDFYSYSYHAHNDFLQYTAEKGIPGGLLYLSIYILVFWNFVRYYRKTDKRDLLFTAFFLSGIGLIFYSVDAFVNFPGDRAEIQVLFILLLASGIAASGKLKLNSNSGKKPNKLNIDVATLIVLIVALFATFFLFQAYQSARLQRLALSEIQFNLMGPADRIVGQFPAVPTISLTGEPIATIEARYLLEEKRYDEVISHLKYRNENPYDSRRELYLAMAYRHLGKHDSALVYIKKAHQLKPYNINIIRVYSGLLGELERFEESYALMNKAEEHWRSFRGTPHGSRYRGYFRQLNELRDDVNKMEAVLNPFNRAMGLFSSQDFRGAKKAFEELFEIETENPHAAVAYIYTLYNLDKLEECINNINQFFLTFGVDLALLNLRGACLEQTGDLTGACRDFEAAMNAGFESAANNYRRFCE